MFRVPLLEDEQSRGVDLVVFEWTIQRQNAEGRGSGKEEKKGNAPTHGRLHVSGSLAGRFTGSRIPGQPVRREDSAGPGASRGGTPIGDAVPLNAAHRRIAPPA